MASSNAVQSETTINTTDTKVASNDSTFTLQFYGKFRVQAPKIENVMKQLERRVSPSLNHGDFQDKESMSLVNDRLNDAIMVQKSLENGSLSKEYFSALQDCQTI